MLDTTTEAGARAEARLQDAMIVWLTTVRSDGQPQSVSVAMRVTPDRWHVW